uniref:DNA-directed RNA polymerase subunit beta'' n=1 Tax=Oltmannsiellopsis viridis TaxID=51324 RepID=RPOC2_OLTVI|nr:beta'' subunit of RNA polymerase [Oltmannsiellopsis viridis]Q20EX3.1 RecName: Full=DNA-directed RNA polymerase subunit beta''; AltName: Full=PEP; AltName: Full=Plastid-encoded RNA polymerase subunit beta''; Short=RNA polymerase subunit beta'' [Oltmannsiellopsis viridis]ABB81940.1 beta'' subunit of RNA polymerase [Oltmannsiellopsis viridis]
MNLNFSLACETQASSFYGGFRPFIKYPSLQHSPGSVKEGDNKGANRSLKKATPWLRVSLERPYKYRTTLNARPVFFNRCFDKGRFKSLILWCILNFGEQKTVELVEQLKDIGYHQATLAGVSLGIDDLKIPNSKAQLVAEAQLENQLILQEDLRGNVTSIEKFQRLIDTWHLTSETLKDNVIKAFRNTDILNPVYMMAFSGARGNVSQVRQLVGMRGLMADPQGQIINFPIQSNFREGLTLTEYVISCYGARKGVVDTALRTATSGYLTRRLVDVAQHVIVYQFDCQTTRGILLNTIKVGNTTSISLQKRLVGRVSAEDIYNSKTNTKEVSRNQEITPILAEQISQNHNQVLVRSALTCQAKHGVCQLCYGWSLAQGSLVSLGEAVGVVAAQSIGEPGTQLTMRTFHTGGVFSGDVMEQIQAPHNGIVEFQTALQGTLIRTSHGKIAFLTYTKGELTLKNTTKAQRGLNHHLSSSLTQTVVGETKIIFPSYTILYVRNGEAVKHKQFIAEYSSLVGENQSIKSSQKVNAEMTGEVFFENVFLRVESSEESEKTYRSFKFSDIWILSCVTNTLKFKSNFSLTKPGDRINTATVINQVLLKKTDEGVATQQQSKKALSLPLNTSMEVLGEANKVDFSSKKTCKGLLQTDYKNLGYFYSFQNKLTKKAKSFDHSTSHLSRKGTVSLVQKNNTKSVNELFFKYGKPNLSGGSDLFKGSTSKGSPEGATGSLPVSSLNKDPFVTWYSSLFKAKYSGFYTPSTAPFTDTRMSQPAFRLAKKTANKKPPTLPCKYWGKGSFLLRNLSEVELFSNRNPGVFKRLESMTGLLSQQVYQDCYANQKILLTPFSPNTLQHSSPNTPKGVLRDGKSVVGRSNPPQHFHGSVGGGCPSKQVSAGPKKGLRAKHSEACFAIDFGETKTKTITKGRYVSQLNCKKEKRLLAKTSRMFSTLKVEFWLFENLTLSLVTHQHFPQYSYRSVEGPPTGMLGLWLLNNSFVLKQLVTNLETVASVGLPFGVVLNQNTNQNLNGSELLSQSLLNSSKKVEGPGRSASSGVLRAGSVGVDWLYFSSANTYLGKVSSGFENNKTQLIKSGQGVKQNFDQSLISQETILLASALKQLSNKQKTWPSLAFYNTLTFKNNNELGQSQLFNTGELDNNASNKSSVFSTGKSLLCHNPVLSKICNTTTFITPFNIKDRGVAPTELQLKQENKCIATQSSFLCNPTNLTPKVFLTTNYPGKVACSCVGGDVGKDTFVKVNLSQFDFIESNQSRFVPTLSFTSTLNRVNAVQQISLTKPHIYQKFFLSAQRGSYHLKTKKTLQGSPGLSYSGISNYSVSHHRSKKAESHTLPLRLNYAVKKVSRVDEERIPLRKKPKTDITKVFSIPELDWNVKLRLPSINSPETQGKNKAGVSYLVKLDLGVQRPQTAVSGRVDIFQRGLGDSEKALGFKGVAPHSSEKLNVPVFNQTNIFGLADSDASVKAGAVFETSKYTGEILKSIESKQQRLFNTPLGVVEKGLQLQNGQTHLSQLETKTIPSSLSPDSTQISPTQRVLTSDDQKTFNVLGKKPLVKVGDFVRYGDFLTCDKKISVSEPGLVIKITSSKITIRIAKPVLVSSGGVFHVQHGDFIEENAPLVTLTYTRLKTGDIVQGIPKIEELFEARISGTLHNQLAIIFENYKQKFSSAYAARKSLERIQQIIVENVLNVYQSQGVTIADKHVEIIVRQMTSKVRILESGRSGLLRGELVTLESVENANKSIHGQKAEYAPVLVGITKAALDIDKSFISAASFQETTRILSRAAIERKTDFLRGLKENVILGQLIPAGTGFSVSFSPEDPNHSKKVVKLVNQYLFSSDNLTSSTFSHMSRSSH